MSGRLCCYKQQQHSKLQAQFVFRVSAFRFNTRTKTRVPLPDFCIYNALIPFVPSCQDTRSQFVDVLDPPFNDVACNIILCLVVGIFYAEKQYSNKMLPFGANGSGNYYASPCSHYFLLWCNLQSFDSWIQGNRKICYVKITDLERQ